MNDIEGGFSSVTNRPRPNNGAAPIAHEVPPVASAAAPSRGVALTHVSAMELLRSLRDTRDADTRADIEATVIADLALRRSVAVNALLPLLVEWHRSGRNQGAETLLLSVLSAVRTIAPARMDAVLTTVSTLRISAAPGPRVFADLSMPGKILVSSIDGADVEPIFAALAMSDPSAVDVGRVVRTTRSPALAARTTERFISWNRRTCTVLVAEATYFAEAIGGAVLGYAGGGPVGMVAGAFAGMASGFADGVTNAATFCGNVQEVAIGDIPTSTGPFNPPGPQESSVPRSPFQVGCTVVCDGIPRCWPPRPSPLPWFPRPTPPICWPYPIASGPALDPLPPGVRPMLRESASGGLYEEMLARFGASAPLAEALDASTTLIHNVPDAEARPTPART